MATCNSTNAHLATFTGPACSGAPITTATWTLGCIASTSVNGSAYAATCDAPSGATPSLFRDLVNLVSGLGMPTIIGIALGAAGTVAGAIKYLCSCCCKKKAEAEGGEEGGAVQRRKNPLRSTGKASSKRGKKKSKRGRDSEV